MLYCSEANNSQNSDFDGPWLLSEELLKLCTHARENPNLNNNVKDVLHPSQVLEFSEYSSLGLPVSCTHSRYLFLN